MPRTVRTKVYSFKELLALEAADTKNKSLSKAVEKARQWLREGATDGDWWYEAVYEIWQDALDEIGFENAEISFSGFWSQGDGASFKSDVDMTKLIEFLSNPPKPMDHVDFDGKKEVYGGYIVHKLGGQYSNPRFAKLSKLVDAGMLSARVIRTDHQHSHWNSCDFELRDEPNTHQKWPDASHPLVADLVKDFVETAEKLRKDMSNIIYNALEEEYEYRTSDESITENAEANEYTFDITGERFG